MRILAVHVHTSGVCISHNHTSWEIKAEKLWNGRISLQCIISWTQKTRWWKFQKQKVRNNAIKEYFGTDSQRRSVNCVLLKLDFISFLLFGHNSEPFWWFSTYESTNPSFNYIFKKTTTTWNLTGLTCRVCLERGRLLLGWLTGFHRNSLSWLQQI